MCNEYASAARMSGLALAMAASQSIHSDQSIEMKMNLGAAIGGYFAIRAVIAWPIQSNKDQKWGGGVVDLPGVCCAYARLYNQVEFASKLVSKLLRFFNCFLLCVHGTTRSS